jgi:transposase-like protein
MFDPPRCPNPCCPYHRSPEPGFYRRRGSYRPLCRAHPVPRFTCRSCGRAFSRQTFRADYRDHRPDLNARLLRLLASGLGLRQSARLLGLSRRCTELKFRKVATHLRHLNLNLRGALANAVLQFDEFETYEGRRNTRPLTIPVLIERDTRFILWAESAPIRPRGRMTRGRLAAIAREEELHGRREDRSRESIERTLAIGRRTASDRILLQTDRKSSYVTLAKRHFGPGLVHARSSGRLRKNKGNPLFPINHTEAMARDLMGRLRKMSWLVSKKGWCLDLALQVFMAYRNYVRRRFNRDRASPAQMLGFVRRRMGWHELVSWRQDWGPELSIHPLAGKAA